MEQYAIPTDSRLRELVLQAQRGDRVAFGALCRRSYGKWLVAIARLFPQHLRTKLDPEDVLQEVLAAAWRELPTLEEVSIGKFHRWILAISRNRVTDAIRHFDRKKRAVEQEDRGERSPDSTAFAGSETPSKSLARREQSAKIADLLEELSRPQRDIIVYRILEEYSREEVANMTGRTRNNVDVILHRALRALNKLMKVRGVDSTLFRPLG